MFSKLPPLALALACMLSVSRAADLPEAVALARYQAMIEKSPFAPATPPPPPVQVEAAQPSFAETLYVTGVAKLGDTDFVTISSRDQQNRFSLTPGQKNSDGIELASVEWTAEPGKTKVTLKKGTEFGVIGFDEAATHRGEGGETAAPTEEVTPAAPTRVRRPRAIRRPFPNRRSGVAAQPGAPEDQVERPRIRHRPRLIRRDTQ